MASFIYDSALLNAVTGKINFRDDNFKVVLLTSAYRPDKANDAYRSDLTDEATGRGYDGGVSTDVKATLVDGELKISLGSMVLPNASIEARYAVYVKDRDGDDGELVACIDFGDNVKSTNADFSLTASTLKIQN